MNQRSSLGKFAQAWVDQRDDRDAATASEIRKFAVWMERQSYSDGSRRNYVRRISNLHEWLADRNLPPLPSTSWRDLRAYGNTLPHTYATRSGLRSAIAVYWQFLKGKKEAPTWAIEQPKKPDYECRALEPEQMERLLVAASQLGELPYAACCAMYYQGLRREETSRLRWGDISANTLRGVGKGRREFKLPLHERFAAALEALEPEGPWILPGKWPGTHVSPATVWMWVRLAAERAGLGRVTPHQLRHTSIATVNDATELRTAMAWARHKDPAQTAVYTRAKIAKIRRGMQAL